MWCLTDLENGKQELVWLESLSDIEISNFKALLTYHFLIIVM